MPPKLSDLVGVNVPYAYTLRDIEARERERTPTRVVSIERIERGGYYGSEDDYSFDVRVLGAHEANRFQQFLREWERTGTFPTAVAAFDVQWSKDQKAARDALRTQLEGMRAEFAKMMLSRDFALAEAKKLRAENERLQKLLYVKRLPERSEAFPREATRFSWLEID